MIPVHLFLTFYVAAAGLEPAIQKRLRPLGSTH